MKAGQAISIPLSTEAMSVLKTVQGQHPQFVFTFRGRSIKEVKTAFRAACLRAAAQGDETPTQDLRVAAGTPKAPRDERLAAFTWHGLRHTWATWHIQNGTPLEVLQKLGGWSDLRMVMNYSHHSPGHLASFADNTRKKT